MIHFQKLAIKCLPAVFAVMILPAAYSYDSAHRTVINVPYAVQVESTVLQPGQYVIRILSPAEPNTVQILSTDEKTIFATIMGVAVYRSDEAVNKSGDKTEFWFSASSSVRPRPVRAWFYPGEERGVEVMRPVVSKKVTKNAEH